MAVAALFFALAAAVAMAIAMGESDGMLTAAMGTGEAAAAAGQRQQPRTLSARASKSSQFKGCSSRRQESHMQRRWAMGAGAGARGCGSHHLPVSRKSPARDEPSFACVVQTRRFLFCFPLLASLVLVGFSRALNSAMARLAGCRARGVLSTRAPRPDDSR